MVTPEDVGRALKHAEELAAALNLPWGTVEFNVQGRRVHVLKYTVTLQEQHGERQSEQREVSDA